MDKSILRKEFSHDWQKHYHLQIFKEKGFERKTCPKCGRGFWTLDHDKAVCGDAGCQTYDFIGKPITKKKYDYISMWKAFEKFFEKNGHVSIPRYPVVARWRPDLYFTNASIIDFMRNEGSTVVFDMPHEMQVVPQVSLRFPDIANVGVSGRHHTSFVMSGQHTMGYPKKGYWKDKCIELNFRFLTEEMGIPESELSYAEDVWAGCGCFGPCIETYSKGLELVNSVFMQFQEMKDGRRELDNKVIDVGWGHERLLWFSNGTPTSYDSAFGPVIEKMKKIAGVKQDKLFLDYAKISGGFDATEVASFDELRTMVASKLGVDKKELILKLAPLEALYAVADHVKTLSFAITDGLLPSNVGGGYNLRILARRALAFLDEFGFDFSLYDVAEWHADFLKPMFPELKDNLDSMKVVFDVEKKRYKATLEKSTSTVMGLLKKSTKFDIDKMKSLYESQGITPEMIEDVGKKQGVDVQMPSNVYGEMTKGHEAEEEAAEAVRTLDLSGVPQTKKLFYDKEGESKFKAKVLKVIDGKEVVLDKTLFYPMGGGQRGDLGTINGIPLTGVEKYNEYIIHKLERDAGFKEGAAVSCEVDMKRRNALTRHHTAVHVVNGAARRILGKHVWQAGSDKDVSRAHLDITHYDMITKEQMLEIEKLANKVVNEAHVVSKPVMDRKEAEKKYGFIIYQGAAVPSNVLRIIDIEGWDVEACGGTHVSNTKEIGLIKIIKTEKLQDGVDRIEFAAGDAAFDYINSQLDLLESSAESLSVPAAHLPSTASKFFREWKEKGKSIERLQKQVAGLLVGVIAEEAKDIPDAKLMSRVLEGADQRQLQEMLNSLFAKTGDAVVVLASRNPENVALCVGVRGKALGKYNAGEILKRIANELGGSGGGKPEVAFGGAPLSGKLEVVFKDVKKYL